MKALCPLLLAIAGLLLALSGCGGAGRPAPLDHDIRPTIHLPPTFTPTASPSSTALPGSTPTIAPTQTPNATISPAFTPEPTATAASKPVQSPVTISDDARVLQHAVDPSPILQQLAPLYLEAANANIVSYDGRRAIIPSPAYTNGIYVRDAFYATLGLEDAALFEEAYRWFEAAQLPSGQIPTAVAFDPADQSLIPRDDESTLIFLIWSGLLQRQGKSANPEVIAKALDFVQKHELNARYLSPPGNFRYWADCWRVTLSQAITYNQGYYALALQMMLEMKQEGVTPEMAERAATIYRAQFKPRTGLFTLSDRWPGIFLQDSSALMPEFLHRLFFQRGMIPNDAIPIILNHRLITAGVAGDNGALLGLKNIANADGSFANPLFFECPTSGKPGDYQNGGNWPLWTNTELALAYSVRPDACYRQALETLVQRELADGSPEEYWELSEDAPGLVSPNRSGYAWNALIVRALRFSGLIH